MKRVNTFVVAPCMLIRLNSLLVQLMHTITIKSLNCSNHLKLQQLLQHVSVYIKQHQGAPSLCFAKVTMLMSVTYIVIWSYRYCGCIFCPVLLCVWIVHCVEFQCNRHQHCNFGEAQAESSLMMFISVFNQFDAQNLFHNKFYFMPLHVSSTCAHHQEVKIALHSL